jgi:hypothetical protein
MDREHYSHKLAEASSNTHGAFEYEVAPNLKIRVAGASYGDPKVEAVLRF